jgi:hypothetical protein
MGKITLLNDHMQYSKELHDDEYELEKHFAGSTATLTQNIIYMAAAQNNQFPMSAITEGGALGRVKTEYVTEDEYDYPVSDNISTRTTSIYKNNYAGDTTTKIGINGTPFEIYTEGALIPTYEYILNSTTKVYCRDVEDAADGMFKGVFNLVDSTDPAKVVPQSDLEVGKKISRIVSINSKAGSRGNGSLFVTPYKKKNMMNTFRKTYKWEGEIPTKVVRFNYTTAGTEAKTLWMDYRKWVFMQEWAYEKEVGIWEGEYNKTADGKIYLKDRHSGNVVSRGSGVWEQIPNWDSYSKLTGSKLKSISRSVFRANNDQASGGRDIKVFGGTIAAENFDAAMKELWGAGRFYDGTDKMVSGSGMDMEYGAYFTKYRTIDGDRFTFVKSDMFDNGPRAEVADHYKDGFTVESGKMVFIDDTMYNGEPNIKMVIRKGMENLFQKVAGVGTQEGGGQPEFVSSDFHGSSHEYMTMRNIQIMRNTNCFVLELEVA